MKTVVEIQEIEFSDVNKISKNVNYPNSGFFMAKIKNGVADLRFVDKNCEFNICIVPETIFNNVVQTQLIEEINERNELLKGTIENKQSEKQKYDGDFILEFSRILLNRK